MICMSFWRLLLVLLGGVIFLDTIRPKSKIGDELWNDVLEETQPLIVSKTQPIYSADYSDTEGGTSHLTAKHDLLGIIRYHYDSRKSSCETVILIGVGTFMSVGEYDNISKKIVSNQSIIVIITDHNFNHIVKTSSEQYANLMNGVLQQLHRLLPVCSLEESTKEPAPQLLFGGHSASGQAAMDAWQQGLLNKMERYNKVAFVGLDPYEIDDSTINRRMGLSIPSLSWGFTRTTCLVHPEKAAKAAYEITKDSRVLYVVDNSDKDCGVTHCIFTDQGCGVRPPISCGGTTTPTLEWIYNAVAESTILFLQCLQGTSTYNHENLDLKTFVPLPIQLYVNAELPPTPHVLPVATSYVWRTQRKQRA